MHRYVKLQYILFLYKNKEKHEYEPTKNYFRINRRIYIRKHNRIYIYDW